MSKGFGISSPGTNQQNRNSTESVEYDELLNNAGEVEEMGTVKKTLETTEEFFVPVNGNVTDMAVPAQFGTKVVTSVAMVEEVGKYARYTVTTRNAGTGVGIAVSGGSVTITGGTVATAQA